MTNKFLNLIAALLLLSLTGSGQSQRLGSASADPTMGAAAPSPSMGGLYSPNLYDGTANINIPIYRYNHEGNEFGVSFGYHTKGVKVDEIASDIGLHWDISCGPSIRRTLKDLPDELNILDGDTMIHLWGGQSYLQPIPGVTYDHWDTISVNRYWAFKGKYAAYSESPASALDHNVYRDKEADDFTVSLPGGTFTFNLGKDGTVFTHPHRNVKIEPLFNGTALTTMGDLQVIGSSLTTNSFSFRITDEQGNTYLFVRSDEEMKVIEDLYGKGNTVTAYTYGLKWAVSEVVLATGGKITYDYAPISYLHAIMPPGKTYVHTQGFWNTDGPDTLLPSNLTGTLKLKSIRYPNSVQVGFYYDERPRSDYPYGALREIRVSAAANCLRYIMRQGFFYADPGNTQRSYEDGLDISAVTARDRRFRLKLDGILLASCDSTVREPYYSFGYIDFFLPERLSPLQDFFGYCTPGPHVPYSTNFPKNYETAIPYHKIWRKYHDDPEGEYGHWWGMDRRNSPISMQAALLDKVQNAYGGTATFHYRAHQDMLNVLQGLPTDGSFLGADENDGTRLDSIVEFETLRPEDKKVTVFQYSGGQRFLTGGYFHYPDKYFGNESANQMYCRVMTSNYVTPHQFVNGSNHGYSHVNVITRTGAGVLLSRKEVYFSNFKDGTGPPKYTKVGSGLDYYTYPYTDKQYLRDWEMGLPLEVLEYDRNDRIVQHTKNRYTFTLDTTGTIGSVENRRVALVPVSGWPVPGTRFINNREFVDEYRPYTGAALLDTTIIHKYISDIAYIGDTVVYKYDDRNNLSAIHTRNSKGQELVTMQAYNYSAGAATGPVPAAMTAAGLEKLIGTERWLLGGGGATTNKLLDAYFNTFNFAGGRLSPRALYNLQSGRALGYAAYTGYAGGPALPPPFAHAPSAFSDDLPAFFVKTSEVTVSDTKGNPLETKMLGQDLYKAMVWDTLTGQKLAEANARLADIAYSGFESGQKGSWTYNATGASGLTDAIAGRKAYYFPNGPITRTGLTADKEYMVAFWASNYSSAPAVTIGGSPVALVPGAQNGNWTYYECRFTPASTSAVLSLGSSANTYIDELRLFPMDAGMQCWSYEPLFGIGSMTDVSGRLVRYGYDKMGRQATVRDQEGNILSKTEHHVAQ